MSVNVLPLRFHELGEETILFGNDAGNVFTSDSDFLERYVAGSLTDVDNEFLLANGHAYLSHGDFRYTSHLNRVAQRLSDQRTLSYLILVPTLRCNLTCSYCQVSRADERAQGFDWSADTTSAVLEMIDRNEADDLKIEFQGGEPTLRIDILEQVYDHLSESGRSFQIVVCSNLQRLDSRIWEFFERTSVRVSTSLDVDFDTHNRQRTEDRELAREGFANIERAAAHLGPNKLSALPTIDYRRPVDFEQLLGSYGALGIRLIYFRPVNYYGFATKAYSYARDGIDVWLSVYRDFIDHLFKVNADSSQTFEEFFFTLCLKRALQPGHDGHVDLRNPNFVAADYLVIDYDGKFYPSDEARMLSRTRRIDLSIGHVKDGLDRSKIGEINHGSLNNFHEDCVHCVYQPICGVDLVDDLARSGRIDMPRHETWFCRRQTFIFDTVFQTLIGGNPDALSSMARWLGVPQIPMWNGFHHDPAAPADSN